jgi:hypothetical protein
MHLQISAEEEDNFENELNVLEQVRHSAEGVRAA